MGKWTRQYGVDDEGHRTILITEDGKQKPPVPWVPFFYTIIKWMVIAAVVFTIIGLIFAAALQGASMAIGWVITNPFIMVPLVAIVVLLVTNGVRKRLGDTVSEARDIIGSQQATSSATSNGTHDSAPNPSGPAASAASGSSFVPIGTKLPGQE